MAIVPNVPCPHGVVDDVCVQCSLEMAAKIAIADRAFLGAMAMLPVEALGNVMMTVYARFSSGTGGYSEESQYALKVLIDAIERRMELTK